MVFWWSGRRSLDATLLLSFVNGTFVGKILQGRFISLKKLSAESIEPGDYHGFFFSSRGSAAIFDCDRGYGLIGVKGNHIRVYILE